MPLVSPSLSPLHRQHFPFPLFTIRSVFLLNFLCISVVLYFFCISSVFLYFFCLPSELYCPSFLISCFLHFLSSTLLPFSFLSYTLLSSSSSHYYQFFSPLSFIPLPYFSYLPIHIVSRTLLSSFSTPSFLFFASLSFISTPYALPSSLYSFFLLFPLSLFLTALPALFTSSILSFPSSSIPSLFFFSVS